LKTHDFYYELPPELIAQTPLEQRDSSRLLVLGRQSGEIAHRHFHDIVDYLKPGDCLVLNNSRVLPARLLGKRATGGAVEVLLLKDTGNDTWECLTKPGRKTPVGTELSFGDGSLTAAVVGALENGNKQFPDEMNVMLTTKDKEIKLGMKLNYVKHESEWETRTEVSNKYREVTIDEILKRFMAL
jgi:S-adenosylmethionine:tRNA ribosyltransferase-isomerase